MCENTRFCCCCCRLHKATLAAAIYSVILSACGTILLSAGYAVTTSYTAPMGVNASSPTDPGAQPYNDPIHPLLLVLIAFFASWFVTSLVLLWVTAIQGCIQSNKSLRYSCLHCLITTPQCSRRGMMLPWIIMTSVFTALCICVVIASFVICSTNRTESNVIAALVPIIIFLTITIFFNMAFLDSVTTYYRRNLTEDDGPIEAAHLTSSVINDYSTRNRGDEAALDALKSSRIELQSRNEAILQDTPPTV